MWAAVVITFRSLLPSHLLPSSYQRSDYLSVRECKQWRGIIFEQQLFQLHPTWASVPGISKVKVVVDLLVVSFVMLSGSGTAPAQPFYIYTVQKHICKIDKIILLCVMCHWNKNICVDSAKFICYFPNCLLNEHTGLHVNLCMCSFKKQFVKVKNKFCWINTNIFVPVMHPI